jgi:hopanoid biosynthesis associated RND transporter like protein HpnN
MKEATPTPHTALIPRLLTALVAAVCRFPRTVLAVSAAVALVSACAFYTRLEYRTQRSDLMNPNKDYQQRWRKYLAEFGDDDDMVVVVEGTDRARMRAAIESLADGVKQRPELFDRLFYKVDLRHLHDRALMFLPAEQIESIQDNLRRMGPLLNGPIGPLAWKGLTLVNLLKQARERAGKLDPSAPLDPSDEQFLTQLLSVVRSAAASLSNPAGYRNPWDSLLARPPQQQDLIAEPQYFFSGDGGLAFLLVHPLKEAESFTPALKSVNAMRDIVAAGREAFPDLQIGLTGLPVLETDEMDASQRDSNLAGYLALGGVALLYLVVYRGLRYPLLTVVTLMAGTFWAMGWLTVTVGHLNILSSTFAVMLIGIGDYGVLLITHYEDGRRAGRGVLDATLHTAAEVGPGVLTAGVSTALAFFAAMLADFQAVAELGWIAGCGVLLCVFACFTVLPALTCLTDRRPTVGGLAVITADGERVQSEIRDPRSEAQSHPWLPFLARSPRWVLAGGLAALAVLAVYAGRVGYDHNLLHMQADGLESVRWEQKLIDRTAGASWCALSVADSPAEALALKARYEQLPAVSRVVEVASLVPADQDRKLDLLRDVQQRLRGLPARGSTITPLPYSPRELVREINFLIGALAPQAPVSPQPILEKLLRNLAELRDHPVLASGALAQERLGEFGRRLAGDLLEDLHRLRDVSAPGRIALDELPAALSERFVGKTGKWLVQAYARDGLWDIGPLAHFVAQARTVDPEATGKPFGTLEGLKAMQHGFAWAGVYALAVIVAVLWADFRTVRHTLLALAPLAVGVVITLGVMGLMGVPLNPANMIGLPLIVGVGVDNGVHVLHDYRARARGRSYTLAATTGQGIAVSALTTVLGFGTLMVARHKGLVGLGLVLTLGVSGCMVAALVLLPAFLRLASKPTTRRAETVASRAA